MPTYWWKAKPEITWAVSLAVLSYLITVLADPGILTAQTWADWRKIVLAAVVGCLRAGIGAVIAQAGPGGFKPDDPPGPVAPPQPKQSALEPPPVPRG